MRVKGILTGGAFALVTLAALPAGLLCLYLSFDSGGFGGNKVGLGYGMKWWYSAFESAMEEYARQYSGRMPDSIAAMETATRPWPDYHEVMTYGQYVGRKTWPWRLGLGAVFCFWLAALLTYARQGRRRMWTYIIAVTGALLLLVAHRVAQMPQSREYVKLFRLLPLATNPPPEGTAVAYMLPIDNSYDALVWIYRDGRLRKKPMDQEEWRQTGLGPYPEPYLKR